MVSSRINAAASGGSLPTKACLRPRRPNAGGVGRDNLLPGGRRSQVSPAVLHSAARSDLRGRRGRRASCASPVSRRGRRVPPASAARPRMRARRGLRRRDLLVAPPAGSRPVLGASQTCPRHLRSLGPRAPGRRPRPEPPARARPAGDRIGHRLVQTAGPGRLGPATTPLAGPGALAERGGRRRRGGHSLLRGPAAPSAVVEHQEAGDAHRMRRRA